MGWDKEKNVQFIIATEATGKFCELQNTLQMSSAFPVYLWGNCHLFLPVTEPATWGPALLTDSFLLRLYSLSWRRDHHLQRVLVHSLLFSIMVSQILTISQGTVTSFRKSCSHLHPQIHIPS